MQKQITNLSTLRTRIFLQSFCVVLLGLTISLSAHANLCAQVFTKNSTPAFNSYTPSKWHLMGDEIAVRVVHSLPDYQKENTDSIWLDFQKDPRYHGRPTTPTHAVEDVMAGLDPNGENTGAMVNLTYLDNILKRASASKPRFFISWEGLGIRAINRLTSRRIYLVGLTDKSMKVDGRLFEQKEFSGHDLAHAVGTELIINSSMQTPFGVKDDFSKIFYKHFNYDSIMSKYSDSEKVLFDLAYFLYFHESVGNTSWGHELAQLKASANPSIEALQDSYLSDFGHYFEFTFYRDGNVNVSVRKKNGASDFLVERFLDKGDLWVNLPPEIRNQINTSPENAKEILEHFIGEMFTVFFKPHYDLARQSLGLH